MVGRGTIANRNPMADFNVKAGWMEFRWLTVSTGLTATYTLGWRITDNGADPWTSRFNRFKDKDKKASFGGARLMYHAFPPLLDAMGLKGKDCTFISALSSSESAADPARQVPWITSQLALSTSSHCAIDALSKQPHLQIHKLGALNARRSELSKAKYVCNALPASNVFVFDDFVTSGSTLSLIAQSVHAVNPNARVFGVALGKTERLAWKPAMNNNHLPNDWDKVWTDGEVEAEVA